MTPAQLKSGDHKDALLLWCALPVDLIIPCESADDAALVKGVEDGLSAALADCTVGISTDDSSSPKRIPDLTSEATVGSVAPKGCSSLRASFLRAGTVMA